MSSLPDGNGRERKRRRRIKFLGWMNGWRDARHLWWRYILLPLSVDVTPIWTSIGLFGFVVFICVEED